MPMKMIAIIGIFAIASTQPVAAASYICTPEQRVECMNGKPCKEKPVKSTEYFIVDVDKRTLEDCELEDCTKRSVMFWQTEHNRLIISHTDFPRTTRLSTLPRALTKASGLENEFTQATLSSVMTVVQSGACIERVSIPPPVSIKP